MKQNLKTGIATFSALIFLLVSLPIHAQPINELDDTEAGSNSLAVKYVHKGDTVPFDGMLLSNEAAITNKVKIETMQEKCNIELEHQKALINAEHQAEIDKARTLINHEKEKNALHIGFQNDQIDFLTKNYKPPSFLDSFAGGMVVGASTMLLTVFVTAIALEKVKNN